MTQKFRIVKAGKSITSTDVRDYLIDDQYAIPKYHNEYTASVTLSPGDKVKTVSITHGLGYVPAFIPYFKDGIDSKTRIIPSIPYGVDFENWANCYADDDKIYFEFHYETSDGGGWNELIYSSDDQYSSSIGRSYLSIGHDDDFGDESSAVRFASIAFAKSASITGASLKLKITERGDDRDDVDFKTYGIDEDDTGDFSSSPMGRSQTTASVTQSQASSTPTFYMTINVKSIFEEINSRASWSSGNDMGFLMFNNGTGDDNWIANSGNGHTLEVLNTGNLTVNFRVIVFKDQIAT